MIAPAVYSNVTDCRSKVFPFRMRKILIAALYFRIITSPLGLIDYSRRCLQSFLSRPFILAFSRFAKIKLAKNCKINAGTPPRYRGGVGERVYCQCGNFALWLRNSTVADRIWGCRHLLCIHSSFMLKKKHVS